MHEAGLTHSDMGGNNLVWDGNKVRLIDWGQATFEGDNSFEREKGADIDGLQETKNYIEQQRQVVDALPKEGGRRKTRRTKKKSKRTRRR